MLFYFRGMVLSITEQLWVHWQLKTGQGEKHRHKHKRKIKKDKKEIQMRMGKERKRKKRQGQVRHGSMQRAKDTWPQILFSGLRWQKVVIPHSNPPASLQPPLRPQRIEESPGNMTAYELKCWKSSHPPCPAVLQRVNTAVRLDWFLSI